LTGLKINFYQYKKNVVSSSGVAKAAGVDLDIISLY
jgi:hypothetical protein